jgi:hypothetical protein
VCAKFKILGLLKQCNGRVRWQCTFYVKCVFDSFQEMGQIVRLSFGEKAHKNISETFHDEKNESTKDTSHRRTHVNGSVNALFERQNILL